MDITDLLINAIIAGLMLGGFYAAVTAGVSISFGMLDIVNIAHPGFIILGSYIAYIVNINFGVDPIVVEHRRCCRRFMCSACWSIRSTTSRSKSAARNRCAGSPSSSACCSSPRSGLNLVFGVDYRSVNAPYIGGSVHLGAMEFPLRMLVPCLVSLAMFAGLQIYLSRTFIGRAVMAVSQDPQALQLMAVNPTRIKRIAFGISIATASMAGAFLIIIQPVIPSAGRDYIGRIFAICVLGGLGSLPGTLIAALLLGVIESITATFYGPSWAPAVAFGILLLTLAVRPSGILGR